MDDQRQNSVNYSHRSDVNSNSHHQIQEPQPHLEQHMDQREEDTVTDISQIIWKKRQIFFEKCIQHNQVYIDEEIRNIRAEYLSECFDLICQVYMHNYNWRQSLQQKIEKWQKMLNIVDTAFLQKYITIKIETGEYTNCYSAFWRSLISLLWNQRIDCAPKIISKLFFDNDIVHLHQILNKIISDIKLNRDYSEQSQSPVFSEDSFNPKVFKAKQSLKKYQKYKLYELISSKHQDIMKKRIQQIRNVNVKNRLMKSLEQSFEK